MFAAVVVSVVALFGAIDFAIPPGSMPTNQPTDLTFVQPFPNPITNQTTFANGTDVHKSAYPILVASPGSTMELWARYSGGNYSGPVYQSASSWAEAGQPQPPRQLNIAATPQNVSISKGRIAVVKYSLEAPQNSTGFYGIRLPGRCQLLPFAVANDSSKVNSSDFPGLFQDVMSCAGIPLQEEFLGYAGAKLAYLTNESRIYFTANITDKSVSSFPTAGGAENITFKMTIHTFSRPIAVGLSLTRSFVTEFQRNPAFTSSENDACSWGTTVFAGFNPQPSTTLFRDLPRGYLQLNDYVFNLGPFSTAHYSFSILISGPVGSYTAVNPAIYVDPSGDDVFIMATLFPVSVSGNLQTISGQCASQLA